MKIALVGNQNSGKTTLFNLLTGMNVKIGNWPGVTIEKKSGLIKDTNYELVDLPGIYSLSPYSIEEEISRKFIFEEKPDVIINIIDATSLERSLYLTTQLLELDCKVIIALNMADILEKKGINLDEKILEKHFGVKVIKISALKKIGINELINEIKINRKNEKIYIYDSKIEEAINQIQNILSINSKNKKFIAVKLLEKDVRFQEFKNYKIEKIINELSNNYEDSLEEIIATQKYKYIEITKKNSVSFSNSINKETVTDKIDKILLNKYLAFPIFIAIMFFMYYAAVEVVGNITSNSITAIIENFKQTIRIVLENFKVSYWLISLVVDGIISGVGSVLIFIPQLSILFLCIAILETTGYMTRVAVILDKIFRKIGLNGKSLIPFIIGSGCSVAGIEGSRIIENEDERKMTAILTPFIPCSAKLPIIVMFCSYFFKENSGLVSASLYFLAIGIIIISSLIMKKYVFKHTSITYICELPEYKIPDIKYIIKDVFEKIISFIKRAGSIILICSIVMWFLLSFSTKLQYGVNIENSILATIGKKISWILIPIVGKNSWEITVSALQGLIAKEQVISSMNVIAGFTENASNIFKNDGVYGFFTKSSAYAFMVFNLFSAPCFGAISAMKKELSKTKDVLKVVIFQILLAWILGTIIYKIGSIIENKTFNISNLFIILGIIIIIVQIIKENLKRSKCNGCRHCAKNH